MNDTWIEEVAREVSRDATAVRRAVDLFDGGATVPFLLRYRREQIGPMNEAELARIRERARQRRDLEERREIVRQEIHETGAMTDELRERIAAARDRATLDDIHLAHKPRPHARAAKAVEAGLAPLADALLDQTSASDAATLAEPFVDAQKGVADADAALAGARDIIAERIHLRPALRAAVRKLYRTASRLVTRLADGIDASRATRYREVHALNEPIGHVSAHRFHLAARGAREGLLAVHLHVEREAICAACRAEAIRNVDAPYVDQIETAIEDACDRLLMPAFETATLAEAREWADGEALDIIETAFRHVLDAPPFGARRVLGVLADEKKGSRAVVVDEKGAVIAEAAFAFDGALDAAPPMEEALLPLIHDHHAQGAAIVRTASARKVAAFLHELGRMDPARRMPVLTFGEAEAGVYAAGPVAREEMPDADIPTRKAASVARRMQDPLAELLKVDPRTINLTSFHSDVDKTHLLERLERVASTYASLVGVDANAANERHLSYIAGIGPQTAAFMKKHRDEQGPFRTRSQFHQIKRMTPTAFEQCAGFLTVAGGENPLDATRIHPERYALVERMAADAKTNVAGLLTDAAARASIDPAAYLDETAGEPTIRFILGELEKPARSERPVFPEIVVDPDVHKLEDLSAGRKLTGVVTSVTDFGAFVDVGLPEEGLVHFTQLSPHRVRAPHEAVTVGMPVTAVVTDIDLERRRLSLSIRAAFPKPEGDARPRGRRRPDGP
ncbi:helix-hairpin-helix domain-containing protein, partial [bacterium]|nr:helix-hairpin-helix domain-containing protein [bacterium]